MLERRPGLSPNGDSRMSVLCPPGCRRRPQCRGAGAKTGRSVAAPGILDSATAPTWPAVCSARVGRHWPAALLLRRLLRRLWCRKQRCGRRPPRPNLLLRAVWRPFRMPEHPRDSNCNHMQRGRALAWRVDWRGRFPAPMAPWCAMAGGKVRPSPSGYAPGSGSLMFTTGQSANTRRILAVEWHTTAGSCSQGIVSRRPTCCGAINRCAAAARQ